MNVRNKRNKKKSKNLSFIGSHCVNPPNPDPECNLKVQYNANAPPAHGENILYVCNAGSQYNRFESDFNRWNFSLTCQENNVFSEEPNVPWPTCVDSKILVYK